MGEHMVDDKVTTDDPLGAEESPLGAPPHVPPPPAPEVEPIPLDDPGEPIVVAPDRPDLDLAEPIGDDPDAPAELPEVADPAAPPPAADPGGLLLERLGALESGLGRRLDALQAAFDREVRAEATREKVVDRLHAELQEYKQGLILGILRPVFVDLIQLHDDMGKMAAAATPAPPTDGAAADAPAEPDRLAPALRGYQQAIEDILYRQGVEPFNEPGPAFDPRRQRALSTVPTADPALNKTVAARLRPGFQAGDKVIRPEMVAVHAHKPG